MCELQVGTSSVEVRPANLGPKRGHPGSHRFPYFSKKKLLNLETEHREYTQEQQKM